MCGNGLLFGPLFIEGNLTGAKYRDLLVEQVFPALMEHFAYQFGDNKFTHLWWAQDGAPAHRFNPVRDILNDMFGHRVIGMGHNIDWPARSPDLTPCDFFLWGHLKSKVFTTPPESLQILRQRVCDEFDNLRQNPGMIRRAVCAMQRRVYLCTEKEGRRVEGRA